MPKLRIFLDIYKNPPWAIFPKLFPRGYCQIPSLHSSSPAWHPRRMNLALTISTDKRHRFPAEIISRCAWLHFRFGLSYFDVEGLMLERGAIVPYEVIRQ